MDDLIAFYRARLDERERKAQRVLRFARESYDRHEPEAWVAERQVNNTEPPYFDDRVVRTERTGTRSEDILRLPLDPGGFLSDHIAEFGSPRFVLDDIAAKRAILDGYGSDAANPPWQAWDDDAWVAIGWTIKVLAQQFTGHPDFRPEWKL